MGQMTALQEGRAGDQFLLGQDGVDVVVRVLRHGCWLGYADMLIGNDVMGESTHRGERDFLKTVFGGCEQAGT